MSGYLMASEISKKPVVTLGGDAIAQGKDVVFDATRGDVRAFTLSGRGLLAGPMKRALSWKNVHALGPDAVVIRDETAMDEGNATAREAKSGPGGENVLGARMLTESGTDSRRDHGCRRADRETATCRRLSDRPRPAHTIES